MQPNHKPRANAQTDNIIPKGIGRKCFVSIKSPEEILYSLFNERVTAMTGTTLRDSFCCLDSEFHISALLVINRLNCSNVSMSSSSRASRMADFSAVLYSADTARSSNSFTSSFRLRA